MISKVKEGLYRILCYVGLANSTSLVKDGSSPAVSGNISNVVTAGNVRNNVPYIFSYGYLSIPNDNVRVVITNAGITGQSPLALGVITPLASNNPVTLNKGEGCNYSNNWILKYGNTGLTAYKIDNADYLATLPSGEWFIKFVRDLINDNNVVLRNYINNQINEFLTTHIHSGGTLPSGNTGAATTTITNIASSTALSQDDSYAANQNCLLNDNAITLP